MTLTMNLNPFMRFDGYYLLSDALEVENLQDRAFAHARWWLRERLFGFGEMAPEAFPHGLGRTLLIYACATWLYRLVLFLGIAVLVYAFFFKVLGLILFAVEIIWFIGLPIFREGAQWWRRRADFQANRNLFISGGLVVFLLALTVIPWRTSIALSAVVQAVERTQVYAPVAARIEAVHIKRGDTVAKGDPLLTLQSPDLAHQIHQAKRRIDVARVQVRREAAGGREAENIRVLRSRLAGEITALRGLEERQSQLSVVAPLNGIVTDLDGVLQTGLWVNDSRPLARVVDLDHARIYGFVDERDLARIRVGSTAVFYPDDPGQDSIAARVVSVADVNSRVLDIAYLASVNGGDVAVEKDKRGNLVAVRGIYRVTLEPEKSQAAPPVVLRGVVHVQGDAQSLLVRAWNRTWGVLMRESGF
ncbi:MAG TPA: efflux RND transporter periplasmic adaptor subunit [Magnetovibrio sp.]